MQFVKQVLLARQKIQSLVSQELATRNLSVEYCYAFDYRDIQIYIVAA